MLARISAMLRGVFRPGALDEEVSQELRFHLDRQIQVNLEAGMPQAEARRAAQAIVGNIDAIREESRAARPGALLHQVARDLMFGMRLLRRAPGLAATSALVVALGIGTTTAIFSVVYGVLLRPLPYPEPERLVAIWTRLPDGGPRVPMNPADHRALRSSNTVFEDVALGNAPQNFNLIGSGEPERLLAGRLSSNLPGVFRITPALGRTFTAAEEQSGRDRVVLLGDALWRRRFGADPSIVGRTINLSGDTYEVVGVMRPDFEFPGREHQLWIPLTFNPRLLTREVTGDYRFLAIARLKPAVSMAQAQRELDAVAARLAAEHPATNRGVRLEAAPLLDEAVRPVKPAMYVLLAAVSCLLFIAALNLASLLGTRAAARTREFAVRLALGASRARLIVQALAEVTPILAIGGAAGIAAAHFAIAAFVPAAPAALPRVDGIQINGPVLAFSILMLGMTGIIGGLMPVLHVWNASSPAATGGTRSATASREHLARRHALVVVQIALTLPLLVGATALVRTFATLMAVDPGFHTENVLSLHMAIPRTKYRSDAEIAVYYRRLLERVSAVPGVAAAALVNRLPLSGNDQTMPIAFDGLSSPVSVQSRSATPEYFRTMSIPLREGRVLSEADTATEPLIAVIDDRLARTLWPGQSAIGRRFAVTLPGASRAEGRIVGVVGNIRHGGLEKEADRQVYFSYHQFTDGRIVLVVRGAIGVRALTSAVLLAIRAIDREQPVYDVRTMDDVVARSTAERWLSTTLVTAFALSSLLLASLGLYGVVAFGVAQRIREFGVRLALGASRVEVSRLVLRRGAVLVACGALLGLGAAVPLALSMRSLLAGATPVDPLNFIAAAAVLLIVALAASYVPARRAGRTDPAVALREG